MASIVTHIKVNAPHDPVYILIGIQSSTAQPLPVTALDWVPERVPRQPQSAIPTILITHFSLSSHLQYLSHRVNAMNFSISYSPLTILKKNLSASANFHDVSLFEWLSYSISSLLVALFSKAVLNYLCALQFTSSFSSLQRASEYFIGGTMEGIVIPPNSQVGFLTNSVTGFGNRAFKEVIKVK